MHQQATLRARSASVPCGQDDQGDVFPRPDLVEVEMLALRHLDLDQLAIEDPIPPDLFGARDASVGAMTLASADAPSP